MTGGRLQNLNVAKFWRALQRRKHLANHSKIFETPKGLTPIHNHDHDIHLILGIVPPKH